MHEIAASKIRDLLSAAERREVALLLALIVVGALIETIGVGLVLPAVVLLSQPDLAGQHPAIESAIRALGLHSGPDLVIGGMLVLVAVYLAKALFLGFLARRQSRFVYAVQAQLSQRLFGIYLRQPWAFHLQRNSAQLIRNLVNEVNLFAFNGLQAGLTLLSECLVLACVGTLLLVVEPLGTLTLLAVLAGASWGFHRLTRAHIARAGLARQHHEGLRLQHLQQGLACVRELKLLGRESEFLQRCRVHTTQGAKAGQRLAMLQQLPRLWLELLAVIGLALLVISMAAQDRAADAMLPTLGLFAAAAFRLLPSVQRLITSKQALNFNWPAIEVLHAEFALGAGEPPAPQTPPAPLRTSLELDRVSFSYPGASTAALEDLSLVVRRGECVAIVGASGAGKSTLVHILLGLLAPGSGELRVDGQDTRHAMRNWQDQIGYVPQSVCLIDDTVTRNVALGLPDERIDPAAVWRALRAAQLEDFVRSLPQGLETLLGERGIRLSGGQCQRIGLARALYHDPGVLILDEPTSSLDSATERELMQAVREQRTRTIVVVAHRTSTVERCDRRYTLEHGRLVDSVDENLAPARRVTPP